MLNKNEQNFELIFKSILACIISMTCEVGRLTIIWGKTMNINAHTAYGQGFRLIMLH